MSKKNKKTKILEEMLPKTETPDGEVQITDATTTDETGDFMEIVMTKNEAEAFLKTRRVFDSTNLSFGIPGLKKTVAKMTDDQTLTMKIPVNEIRDALLAAAEKLGIDADKIINGDTKDLVEAIKVPKLMELGLRFVNDNELTDLFAAVMGKSSDKPEESKETPKQEDKSENKAEEKPEAKKDDVIQVKGNKTITDPTQMDFTIEAGATRHKWECNAPAYINCRVGTGGWQLEVLATATVKPNGEIEAIHAVSFPVFPELTKDSLIKEELEEIKKAITADDIIRCCDMAAANELMTSVFNVRSASVARRGYTVAPIIDQWTWRPKAAVKAV